jgi:hypothetical protein
MLTDEKLLDVKEVAQIIRQSSATVYWKVASGELDAIRLGRGHQRPPHPRERARGVLARPRRQRREEGT